MCIHAFATKHDFFCMVYCTIILNKNMHKALHRGPTCCRSLQMWHGPFNIHYNIYYNNIYRISAAWTRNGMLHMVHTCEIYAVSIFTWHALNDGPVQRNIIWTELQNCAEGIENVTSRWLGCLWALSNNLF